MSGRNVVVCVLCGVCLLAPDLALADYQGSGKASDDFASYNIRAIGLLVIGSWKGSDAKIEPTSVAMALKARLRELGYEINDVKDKKHLKTLEQTVDAILTVKYQSMAGQETPYYYKEDPSKLYRHLDRFIKGTAEMATTKRISKKRKVVFKAAGQTTKQVESTGVGDGITRSNPAQDFASIVGELPPVPDAEKGEAKKEEPKKEDEKKDEKKEEGGKKDEKKKE